MVLSHPDKTNPLLRAAVGLTLTASLSVVAGMTDAIGFSQSGEFVSFMSGNTTRMAIAFSDGDLTRGRRLAMVLALFVLGNVLGAMVAKLGGQRHGTVLLMYVGSLLALAAGLPALPGVANTLGLEALPGIARLSVGAITLPSLVLSILAMGALNSAVESVEGVGLGLTYVTGALSKFGRGLGKLIMGERRFDWVLHLGPFLGLVIGAFVGNLLDDRIGRRALWLPCGVTFLLALCSVLVPEDWQRRFI
jgi:uncharacterized membrane protein YoaK (UPF0700 family)